MAGTTERRRSGHDLRGDGDPEELARRAAGGDRAALEELLRVIEPRVLRQVSRFLPYRQDAEEATQDVLLKVATRIGTFEGRSRFSTWLHEVTANQARQTYRSLRRRAAESATDAPVERPDPRTTSVIAGSRLDLLDALERLETEHPDWSVRSCCATCPTSSTRTSPGCSTSPSAP
jgi:RNA polymerase sigma-70 factor (ECF subfamily)